MRCMIPRRLGGLWWVDNGPSRHDSAPWAGPAMSRQEAPSSIGTQAHLRDLGGGRQRREVRGGVVANV